MNSPSLLGLYAALIGVSILLIWRYVEQLKVASSEDWERLGRPTGWTVLYWPIHTFAVLAFVYSWNSISREGGRLQLLGWGLRVSWGVALFLFVRNAILNAQ